MPTFRLAAIAAVCLLANSATAQSGGDCVQFAVEPHDIATRCPWPRLSLRAVTVFAPVPESLQWFRDGVPVQDGPGPGGSAISGSRTNELAIDRAGLVNNGRYSLQVTRPCGQAMSREATVAIELWGRAMASSLFVCAGEPVTVTFESSLADPITQTLYPIGPTRTGLTISTPCQQLFVEGPVIEGICPEGFIQSGLPGPFLDAITSGTRTVAMRENRTLAAWHIENSQVIADGDAPSGRFLSIADAANGVFILIREDGTLAIYPSGINRPIATPPAGQFVAAALCSGGIELGAAVSTLGELVEWGTFPSAPGAWGARPAGSFSAVRGFADGFVATRRDGVARFWGRRPNSSLGASTTWVPPRPADLVFGVVANDLSFPTDYFMALEQDGTLFGSPIFTPTAGFRYPQLRLQPGSITALGRGIRRSDGLEMDLGTRRNTSTIPVRSARTPRIYAGAILHAPSDTTVTVHRTASFATGATRSGITYRWSHNGVDLTDGPTGAGSVISGALTASLQIDDARASDSGLYTLTTVSPCETRAASATLTVRCATDLTADGTIDADDLSDYLSCYFSSPSCPDAEFTGDGDLNADDLAEFINAYFSGCEG